MHRNSSCRALPLRDGAPRRSADNELSRAGEGILLHRIRQDRRKA